MARFLFGSVLFVHLFVVWIGSSVWLAESGDNYGKFCCRNPEYNHIFLGELVSKNKSGFNYGFVGGLSTRRKYYWIVDCGVVVENRLSGNLMNFIESNQQF